MNNTTIRHNKINTCNFFMETCSSNVEDINIYDQRIIKKKKSILYQFINPVPTFTGRKHILEKIHTVLKEKNILVIRGIGGIGKTQLLRAYGQKYCEFYNKTILWINSEKYDAILTSFQGLATELGILTKFYNNQRILLHIVTDIYKYFKTQILVIFDNAIHYKDLQKFLLLVENYQHIHVLISSQNVECGDIENIALSALSDKEARDLIINQLNKYLTKSEKDDDISELVSTFENMPLGLQEAVAFIIDKKKYVSKNYRIKDYINEIKKEDGNILNKDFEGSPFPDYTKESYDKTTAKNVQMIIETIKKSGQNLSIDLFYIISYLPSDNIDKELFSFMTRTEAYQKENLDESIRVLAKYSAVTIHETDKISIHRLIQMVVRYIIKSHNLHEKLLKDALYITHNFIQVDEVYFSSVLDHVEKYPHIFLNFYKNNEDQIRILNLLTRHNYLKIIENIFKYEYIDLSDNTIILQAVRTSNMKMVKFFVDKGAKIYSKDNDGWTPFHYSLGLASTEIAQYFIDLDVDLNEVNSDSFTPLAIAAASNIDMVKLLLSNRVNVKVNFQISPLVPASVGGHLDIIKLLIEEGIPTKRQISTDGNEVQENVIPSEILGQVLENSHLNVMEFLLQNNICKIEDIPFDKILGNVLIENNYQIIDFCLKNVVDLEYLLFRAAFIGNIYAVEKLLKQNVNVNTRQVEGCTPIYIASQEGHLCIVEKLLEYRADIHLQREDNETPLSAAAKNGRMEIVKLLVELGADVNIQGNHSFTPAGLALTKEHEEVFKYLFKRETISARHIFITAYTNNVRMAEYLINNGVNIDILDEYSYNALMYASQQNNTKVMSLLLDKGANINMTNVDGETALFRAVSHERVEAVKLLVNRGADLNIQRIDTQSALEVAVENGFKEIAEILIKYKANMHRDDELPDALCYAVLKGSKYLLEYLILFGGQINRVYELNYNLLGYATCVANVEIFEFLAEKDPSLLFMELEGTKQTLAHVAAEIGYVHMFDVLLKNGISLSTRDSKGITPIVLAASFGKTEAVEYLLLHGCDVDGVNDFGNAPLQHASAAGHIETVHLILSYNASVDLPDKAGDTALHDAASKGYFFIVKCLLEYGANVNLVNQSGKTPLDLAINNGPLQVVDYLSNGKY